MNAEDREIIETLFDEDERAALEAFIVAIINEHMSGTVKDYIAKDVNSFCKNAISTEVESQLKKAKVVTALKGIDDVTSVTDFLNSMDIEEIVGESVNDVYLAYRHFSIGKKIQPVSKKMFTGEVRRKLHVDSRVTTRDGKSVRIYTR